MKTRKIISIMAALIMAVTVTGCNNSGELFKVTSEPSVSEKSEEERWANADDSEELIPKINATSRPEGSVREYDYFIKSETADEFFGAADDEMYAEAPDSGEAVTNGIVADTPTTTAEAPAKSATDGIADTAPAPGYEDVYIIDDDLYEYSQVEPKAGLLTAGIWNDNENWGFFTNLINNDKITIPTQYGLEPTKRIKLTVKAKDSKPVVNAKVRGLSEKGEIIWSAVTDKNGIAYLFDAEKILDAEIESQGKTEKVSFAELAKNAVQGYSDEQTVMKTRDIEETVTFDVEGKNYEKTEIMFVVDTTGSMGDELLFLQSEFTAIAEEVGTDNTRFSINFYRDEYDDYTTKRYPFSGNIEEINKKLNSEYASGGGDLPEAVAEILDETINDGGWSDESVKLMFMIFDAPPHDDKAQVLESAVKKAAAKGIRIIPVVSSNSDRNTELFGRSVAIMTGGTYVFLTDDSGIGYSHLEPIIGEYKVEKLYDIIVRIINEHKQGEIKTPSEPSEEVKEVSEIIDRTVTEQITTDTALEKFYEDNENEYFYGSIRSEYVIVKYTDGTQETVGTALKNGTVTLADLDRYNIHYIKQQKAKTSPSDEYIIEKFSFKDENTDGARTDGFVNTTEGDMTNVAARAKLELDALKYTQVHVFYDSEADVWKVNFSNDDTAGGDVSIYLDGKGITKLIVYGE